jgi:hypothetical protein
LKTSTASYNSTTTPQLFIYFSPDAKEFLPFTALLNNMLNGKYNPLCITVVDSQLVTSPKIEEVWTWG